MNKEWTPSTLLSPATRVSVWNPITRQSIRNVLVQRYVITYQDHNNGNIEDWEGIYPSATFAAIQIRRFGRITILAVHRNGYPVFARYAGEHLEPAAR